MKRRKGRAPALNAKIPWVRAECVLANAKGQVNHFGVHGTFKPPRVLCNTSMRFSLTSYHRRLQALLFTSAPSQIRTCPRITSSCSRSAPLSNKVRKGSVPSVHLHLLTGRSEPYLPYYRRFNLRFGSVSVHITLDHLPSVIDPNF